MSAPLFRRALMSSIKNHIAESFFTALSLVSLSSHSDSQNLAEGMFQVIYHFFHKKRNLDYYKSNNFIFYNVVTCGIRFHISGCSYQEVTAPWDQLQDDARAEDVPDRESCASSKYVR